MMTEFNLSAATDRGQIRVANEDMYIVANHDVCLTSDEISTAQLRSTGDFIAAVADGMGGRHAGVFASRRALEIISKYLLTSTLEPALSDAVSAALMSANATILRASSVDPNLAGCGATIALIVWRGSDCCIARVGGSTVFLIRQGEIIEPLRQLEMVRFMWCGKPPTDYPPLPSSDVFPLLSCLGSQSRVSPSVAYFRPQNDDTAILCSDGITMKLAPDEILAIVRDCGYAEAAKLLVGRANKLGGEDNLTACLVHFGGVPKDEQLRHSPIITSVHVVDDQYSGDSEVGQFVADLVRWYVRNGRASEGESLARSFPEDSHRDFLITLLQNAGS